MVSGGGEEGGMREEDSGQQARGGRERRQKGDQPKEGGAELEMMVLRGRCAAGDAGKKT